MLLGVVLVVAGCSSSAPAHHGTGSAVSSPATPSTLPVTSPASTPAPSTSPAPPRLRHVVVVVEENHSYADIAGSSDAPYLNSLIARGASLTNYFAVTHPSEPNYLALFSGSTQGLTDDSCPHSYAGPNLAGELLAAGHSFVGYSQDLPAAGDQSCSSGSYARKHNPWVNFPALPASVNQPWSAFPADYGRLPDVAFVVPNLDNDMHDGSVAQGDAWLQANLDGYARWAVTHDSALVVTWDEDDHSQDNQVAAIVVGAGVRTGPVPTRADHYTLLRTLEWLFGVPAVGESAARTPLTSLWATR